MFRFTIRDVLWLTVVVALAVGWWVEHRRHARDAEEIRALRYMRNAYMERAEQLLEGVQQLEQAAAKAEKLRPRP